MNPAAHGALEGKKNSVFCIKQNTEPDHNPDRC